MNPVGKRWLLLCALNVSCSDRGLSPAETWYPSTPPVRIQVTQTDVVAHRVLLTDVTIAFVDSDGRTVAKTEVPHRSITASDSSVAHIRFEDDCDWRDCDGARMALTLTSRKNGTSVYTVRGAGLSADIRVTFDVVPFLIVMLSDSLLLTVGDSIPVAATVLDSNLWAIPGLSVSWSSSDPGVSGVTDDGLVRALASGTARVSATSGGLTGTTEVSIPDPPISFVRLISGYQRNCGLTSDGRIYCWGRVLRAQPTGPGPFVAAVRGSGHTCALDVGGTAWCWGSNGAAQLGDGTSIYRDTAVRVLGSNRFVALASGRTATCGIRTDSLAYCWGTGPLEYTYGVPTVIPGGFKFRAITMSGDARACGLGVDDVARCWGPRLPPNTGKALVPEGIPGLKFRSLSVGHDHACGISTEGATYCWGGNASRQADPEGAPNFVRSPKLVSSAPELTLVAAGEAHTCGQTIAGAIHCWGQASRLPDLSSSPAFTSMTATCGLVASGGVYCWGSNGNGELGDGTLVSSTKPVHVLGTAR